MRTEPHGYKYRSTQFPRSADRYSTAEEPRALGCEKPGDAIQPGHASGWSATLKLPLTCTVGGTAPSSPTSYPSHLATTALARQLPSTLVDVRAMSISASTPSRTAAPSMGRWKVVSVPARITSAARGTPATPLLVSMRVSIISSCWPNERVTPAAWATKTEASERYSVVPSRLKL